MSQPLTIIGNYISPYVRKVLVCLEHKGIAYQIDPMTPFIGNDAFTALSPLRRVPVLLDGELVLNDSSDTIWIRHEVAELTLECLKSLANAVAVFNGMKLQPIMSLIFPDGERGQLVMPPACVDGTLSLSIRKHSSRTFTLAELAAGGAFDNVEDVSFNSPTRVKSKR